MNHTSSPRRPADLPACCNSAPRAVREGFTLVELLVVIAIIGILMSTLLPAVGRVRAAADRTDCANHLRQVGLASLAFESSHGMLPSGGWGSLWLGDPERGVGSDQPGGWTYQLLPFLEQQSVHDLPMVLESGETKEGNTAEMITYANDIFYCPGRRRAQTYPFSGTDFHNATAINFCARTDYAANGGDANDSTTDGAVEDTGPDPSSIDTYDYQAWNQNGVIYQLSQIQMAGIRDGQTQTYLIGERYLSSDHYTTGLTEADDRCVFAGYDDDNVVFANEDLKPLRDAPEVYESWRFGSAHSSVFQVVFCDGHVQPIPFTVDLEVHGLLANRSDGKPISSDSY